MSETFERIGTNPTVLQRLDHNGRVIETYVEQNDNSMLVYRGGTRGQVPTPNSLVLLRVDPPRAAQRLNPSTNMIETRVTRDDGSRQIFAGAPGPGRLLREEPPQRVRAAMDLPGVGSQFVGIPTPRGPGQSALASAQAGSAGSSQSQHQLDKPITEFLDQFDEAKRRIEGEREERGRPYENDRTEIDDEVETDSFFGNPGSQSFKIRMHGKPLDVDITGEGDDGLDERREDDGDEAATGGDTGENTGEARMVLRSSPMKGGPQDSLAEQTTKAKSKGPRDNGDDECTPT